MKAKGIIIGLLLLFILPELADAQPWRKRRYRRSNYGYAQTMLYGTGAKFGVLFFDYKMNYDGPGNRYSFKPDFAYHTGVSGEYFIKYNIDIRADVLFSQRKLYLNYNYGDEVDPSDDHLPDRVDWRLLYLMIPLRVNYNYLYSQHLKAYISAGLMPEFKTQDFESVTYLSGRVNENYKLLYNHKFNRVNLAGNLSLGFKYNYSGHVGMEIEAGIFQYVGKVNKDFSTGPPWAYYAEFGFFYDF